jgi:hypothetical protein
MEEVSSELQRIKEKESRYAARNKKQEEGKTIFSASLSPRNYVIPDEIYKKYNIKPSQRAFDAYRPMGLLLNALSGEGAFSGMDRVIPESKLRNLESALKQSRNEMRQRQQGLASGGLTAYANGGSLEQSFDNPYANVGSSAYPYPRGGSTFLQDRYTDEDGLDYSQALLDASMLIPSSLLLRGAGLGLKGLYQSGRLGDFGRFLGRQGQRTYSKPNPDLIKGPGFIAGAPANKLKGEVAEAAKTRVFSPTRAGITSAAVGIPAANIVDYMSEDYGMPEQEQRELTQAEKDYQKLMQDIQLANLKASQEDTKKGLGGAFSSTDLIQLGGTIMGAKNISELGQGIAAVAGASADRKTAAERADLEARYLQAQTGKLEEETRLLPERQLTSQIDAVVKAIKQAEESGTDDARLQELRTYLQYLIASQAQTQGYNPQAMSGTNQSLIASYT